MANETDRPYWFPELTDAAWITRVRADYPEETEGMSDEWVRDKYAGGYKYADTWDHLGDARHDYERLADAYLDLLKRSGLVDPHPSAADEKMPVVAWQAPDERHSFISDYAKAHNDRMGELYPEGLVRQSDAQAAILAAVAPLQAEIERLRKDFDAAIDAAIKGS